LPLAAALDYALARQIEQRLVAASHATSHAAREDDSGDIIRGHRGAPPAAVEIAAARH
jgi:hypothetical protein